MKVVIIEDEALAAGRLEQMILEYDGNAEILARLESVEESVEWFLSNPHPDLIFLDIQLEDDLSFAIFDRVDIRSSVIFTTAFDEYAIRAFRLRSIDYLLKPVVQEELNAALGKYREMSQGNQLRNELNSLMEMITGKNKSYRERFSVKVGMKIRTFPASDVAWFFSEGGYTCARLKDGKNYDVDFSLDKLESELNPGDFFRINRKMLVSLSSIKEAHLFSKSRLKLELEPDPGREVLVSIDRSGRFRKWLDGERG